MEGCEGCEGVCGFIYIYIYMVGWVTPERMGNLQGFQNLEGWDGKKAFVLYHRRTYSLARIEALSELISIFSARRRSRRAEKIEIASAESRIKLQIKNKY